MTDHEHDGHGPEPPNGDDHSVIRLPRTRSATAVEQPEIQQGARPGQRIVRVQRRGERRFEPAEEGTIRATARAIEPRGAFERSLRSLRRVFVGKPLSTEEVEEQRLPKGKALAIFSSDALSSSAYATDEILIVLAAAGTGALTHSIELGASIALLLAIVAFSYRQTIRAYPSGGGAYIVARENLGDASGLIAAASLAVDYVLTVSVSIAAGVLAIVSAFPGLAEFRIEIAVGAIALITLANLRGIRESGTIFAIPTYGFIFSFGFLILAGLVKVILNPDLQAEVPESVYEPGASALSAFLILRAFSSGCTALTGIEAISNGVPAFTKPESRNAATTLIWMAAILTSFFLGITILAHMLDVQPASEISVAAQIGLVVFGKSPLFYVIQAFTALILILAANTSYADFPRLASILARDRFLPHQFTFRGDRLAFSNGIIVLGTAAAGLVVAFQADVTKLIPLYAFGVFVSFTFSQTGMVRHWLHNKEPGWRRSIVINGLGAFATGVVAVIVGATKFEHGAWISMLAMAVLAATFWTVHRHFRSIEKRLALKDVSLLSISPDRRQPVIVPVDEVNLAAIKALSYARSVSDNVTAVYVTDDHAAGQQFLAQWESKILDVPLVVIDSPYRSFIAPFLSYLDAVRPGAGQLKTVVVPEYLTAFPWERWLHNQSVRRLRNALKHRTDIVTAEVPYDLVDERDLNSL
ncbi:MAG TPA: APC family permease [Dehalococcoidia bacterium]|nr:APC family permease [Dehalococcoidia bacterium]